MVDDVSCTAKILNLEEHESEREYRVRIKHDPRHIIGVLSVLSVVWPIQGFERQTCITSGCREWYVGINNST